MWKMRTYPLSLTFLASTKTIPTLKKYSICMSKCLLIHHVKFLKASHIKLVRLYIIYISITKFVNLCFFGGECGQKNTWIKQIWGSKQAGIKQGTLHTGNLDHNWRKHDTDVSLCASDSQIICNKWAFWQQQECLKYSLTGEKKALYTVNTI